jgi:hypothetical protein
VSYYDPYPTVSLERPIVLMGPPWSGVLACAAWIANTTGIRFVDLDAIVEHRMETSVVSLGSAALEGTFRDAQLAALRDELLKQPFALFATEDVGFWPSFRGLSTQSFYTLTIQPSREQHFESYQKSKRGKTREKFARRPWLLQVPTEFEAFCDWIETEQGSHRIAQRVLDIDSVEPITMSKIVMRHLHGEGIVTEYGS